MKHQPPYDTPRVLLRRIGKFDVNRMQTEGGVCKQTTRMHTYACMHECTCVECSHPCIRTSMYIDITYVYVTFHVDTYIRTYIHLYVYYTYMYACTPTHLHDSFHHCVILRIIFGQCIHLPGILKEVVQQRRVFLGLLVIRTAVNVRIGLRANWGAARPNT